MLMVFTAGNMCKKCGSDKDNRQHIISHWEVLVSTEYKTNQFRIARHTPQEIMLIGISVPYNMYALENVTDNEQCKIYCNQTLITDK